MKKVLAERYGGGYARDIPKRSKKIYRELIEEVDDTGDDNPMVYNEMFAPVFVAPYLANEKKIPPETAQEMTCRSLYFVKWLFLLTNLNTKRGKEINKKNIVKCYRWYTEEKEKLYPTPSKVDLEGGPYEGARYYRITRCPICTYTKKLGVYELMPLSCELDEVMINLRHGVLYRKGMIVSGADCCDYLITDDRE